MRKTTIVVGCSLLLVSLFIVEKKPEPMREAVLEISPVLLAAKVRPGYENQASIAIINKSSRDATVVGFSQCCSDNCQYEVDDIQGVTIHAFSTYTVPCKVTPIREGAFQFTLHLYAEQVGLVRLSTVIEGSANSDAPVHQ